MTTDQQGARYLAMVTAAKKLERDALVAAGACAPGSPDWRFYHGVMEAALDQIHPERVSAHEDPAWLNAQPPSFRTGFLEALTLLSRAATSGALPTQFPLPHPPAYHPRSASA